MDLPRYFTVNDRPVRFTAAGSGMRIEALRKDGRYEPAPEYTTRCLLPGDSDDVRELSATEYNVHSIAWVASFRR
jgi:hypothetical protein